MLRKFFFLLAASVSAFAAEPTVSVSPPGLIVVNEWFDVWGDAHDSDGNLSSMGIRWQGYGLQNSWSVSGYDASHYVSCIVSSSGWYNFRTEAWDTDSNGVAGDWQEVEARYRPDVYLSGPTTLSVGQSGTWTFSASDGDGDLVRWRFRASTNNSAAWSTISGSSTGNVQYSQSFSTPGTYTWIVEVEDSYGLANDISLTVYVKADQAAVSLSPSSSVAATTGDTISFTASGGSGTGAYNWGGSANGTGTSKSIQFNTPGNFSVTVYRAGDSTYYQSTTVTTTVTVRSNQASVSISPTSQTVNVGDSVSFTASGGSGSGAYTWGGDGSGTGSSKSVTFSTPGTRTVSVYRAGDSTYKDSSTASATITVRTPLTVTNGSGSGNYLSGTSVSIVASPPTGYTFSNWSVTSGSGTFANANAASTSFTVGSSATVITANGTAHNPTVSVPFGPLQAMVNETITIGGDVGDSDGDLRRHTIKWKGTVAQEWTGLNTGYSEHYINVSTGTTTGNQTIRMEAEDSRNATASNETLVNILPPNDPPVAVSVSASVSGTQVTLTGSATDSDGNLGTLIFKVCGPPNYNGYAPAGEVDIGTKAGKASSYGYSDSGSVVWNPGSLPSGTYFVWMRVQDSPHGAFDSNGGAYTSFTVGDAPSLSASPASVPIGNTLTVSYKNLAATSASWVGIFHFNDPDTATPIATLGATSNSSTPTNLSFDTSTGYTIGQGYNARMFQSADRTTRNAISNSFTITENLTLTVVNGTVGGASSQSALQTNDQLTIVANSAPSGQVFDRWTANAAGTIGNNRASTTTFTMNGASVTVTASFATPTTPSITTQPQSLTKVAGQSATFTVVADAVPAPTYQWRKNGANIANATNTSYTISSVTTSDAAEYTVVVTNSQGSTTSNPAVLTVQTVPSITVQPQNRTASVGTGAIFSVTATGNPTPTYQWRKDGTNISGATQSTLTITTVQTTDAATYTVVVTNAAGSATSNPATLTVTSPVIDLQIHRP